MQTVPKDNQQLDLSDIPSDIIPMVHASVEKCGTNTSLRYITNNWEVVKDGAITHHGTFCTRNQAGYQFEKLWGIRRRARILQSTSPFTGSNS